MAINFDPGPYGRNFEFRNGNWVETPVLKKVQNNELTWCSEDELYAVTYDWTREYHVIHGRNKEPIPRNWHCINIGS